MSFDGIDVFVEVVNANGFSRAAKRLGMPTTTVSAKIARLEHRLGVTLLQRTTRQIQLTEAGRLYYEYCTRAVSEMAAAENRLAQRSEEPSGTLRLTAPADLAQSLLGPVLQTYLKRHPKVSIDLHVSNDYQDLIGEKFDLAMRFGHLTDSTLIMRKFLTSHMGLWASADYLASHGTPQTADDLAEHQIIALNSTQEELALSSTPDEPSLPLPQGRLLLNDLQTCQTYVEQGFGIGLLPEFSQSASRGLVRVLPSFQSKEFTSYFIYPKQSFVPLTVRSFIETALECMRR